MPTLLSRKGSSPWGQILSQPHHIEVNFFTGGESVESATGCCPHLAHIKRTFTYSPGNQQPASPIYPSAILYRHLSWVLMCDWCRKPTPESAQGDLNVVYCKSTSGAPARVDTQITQGISLLSGSETWTSIRCSCNAPHFPNMLIDSKNGDGEGNC